MRLRRNVGNAPKEQRDMCYQGWMKILVPVAIVVLESVAAKPS